MSVNLKRETVQQRILSLLDKLPTETLVVIEQIVQLFYRQLGTVEKKPDDDMVSARSEANGAVPLMTMVGMFASGHHDTSENVKTIVNDFILEKYTDDRPTSTTGRKSSGSSGASKLQL